jgi:tetratricopeptide (TPR) repeat protein
VVAASIDESMGLTPALRLASLFARDCAGEFCRTVRRRSTPAATRPRSLQSAPALALIVSLAIIASIAPGCRQIELMRPGQAEAAFEDATREYREGRYDEAAGAFAIAARDLARDEDRASALHNLGNALAQAGRSTEALDAYRAALRLGDREGTRMNYEIVRARVPQRHTVKPPARRDERDDRLFDAARQLALPPATARRSPSERRTADW